MVSEACCNRNRTQAVFPEPVIPAIMEVKGCSKRNRWHFCENIGTVWNGVRPALRCLDITCLCILSFLLKDFSQTEQNQLMSTPQEQNVDWERGRMLRTYIGFQAIKFNCFPLPRPPLPHFNNYCFPSSSTTATTTFLLFFFPPPPPPPHFKFDPSRLLQSLRIRNHPAFFGSSNFAVLYKLVPDELGDVFMLCRNTCTFSMVRIQHSNMINHQPS